MEIKSLPKGLYAICGDGPARAPGGLAVLDQVRGVLAGGCRVLQLRLKNLGDREAVALLREVLRECREAGALCLVNDRVDWALVTRADGVHLGAEDLPIEAARQVLGRGFVIGATTRNREEIQTAARLGADYVGLGPVFPTQSKQLVVPTLGLASLERIVTGSPLPVVAIGGVSRSNIEDVARTGVWGAAVIGDLLGGVDESSVAKVAERARALQNGFQMGANATNEELKPGQGRRGAAG